MVIGAGWASRSNSALILAKASGRYGHSLALAYAPYEPMRREVNSKASALVLI